MIREVAGFIFDRFVSKEQLLKAQRKLEFKLSLVNQALELKRVQKVLVISHDGNGQNLSWEWRAMHEDDDFDNDEYVVCWFPEDKAKDLGKFIKQFIG